MNKLQNDMQKYSAVYLKKMPSPASIRPNILSKSPSEKQGRLNYAEKIKQPVKTVQIIRKVEYSSRISSQDRTSDLQITSPEGDRSDGEAGKKKCILLIVKKNRIDKKMVVEENLLKKPKQARADAAGPPAKPNVNYMKFKKQSLQSLPELRQLINFHRSKHAELIQENQLYDTNLGFQNVTTDFKMPSTVKQDSSSVLPFKESVAESGILLKFPYSQPKGCNPTRPFSGIFKIADEDAQNLLQKRSVVEVKQMKLSPKFSSQPLQNLKNEDSKTYEIDPTNDTQLNTYSPSALGQTGPTFSSTNANFDNFTSATVSQKPKDPRRTLSGIVLTDEQFPTTPKFIRNIKLPSLLDYHNVTILTEDTENDWNGTADEDHCGNLTKKCDDCDFDVSFEFADSVSDEYVPNNPNFDFKNVGLETYRRPAEVEEPLQAQDFMYEEEIQHFRNEIILPSRQPFKPHPTASACPEGYNSKGNRAKDSVEVTEITLKNHLSNYNNTNLLEARLAYLTCRLLRPVQAAPASKHTTSAALTPCHSFRAFYDPNFGKY